MRRALLVTATALLPNAIAAQAPRRPEPAVSLLLSVGAGSTPDVTASFNTESQVTALAANVGVRVRPRRGLLFADATLHAQGEILLGDDVLMAPIYQPGHTYRHYASRLHRTDDATGVDVRIGVDGMPSGGPVLRAAAGAGYMSGLREPYTLAAIGAGSHGRRVRFTLDAERRWMRLPADEFTPTAMTSTFVAQRTVRVAQRSTFVRAGVEVP